MLSGHTERPTRLVRWAEYLVEPWLRAHSSLVYLILYIPIVVVIVYAFNDSRLVAVWEGFTTHWFGDALRDVTVIRALENSVKVASINAVLATSFGLGCALALRRVQPQVKFVFDSIIYATLITPEVVVALASLIFFVRAGIPLGLPTIIATHAVWNTSVVTLLVRARLAGMDRTLEEASFDLGATPWGTFRQITLPLLMPAVVAGFLLSFTFSFDDFILSFFVSGPGSTTLPVKIFSMLRFGVSPITNALSAMILAFALAVVFLAQYLLSRESRGVRLLRVR
ncbi:MAG TPA: ABC transporter permease [Candidatus Methylomirabilis sp.]|nr:ABC transporter permease [Candidatus Methylomirabilis sp.]